MVEAGYQVYRKQPNMYEPNRSIRNNSPHYAAQNYCSTIRNTQKTAQHVEAQQTDWAIFLQTL